MKSSKKSSKSKKDSAVGFFNVQSANIILRIVLWFFTVVFALYFVAKLYLGQYFLAFLLLLMVIVLHPGIFSKMEKKFPTKFPILLRFVVVIFLLTFYVAMEESMYAEDVDKITIDRNDTSGETVITITPGENMDENTTPEKKSDRDELDPEVSIG